MTGMLSGFRGWFMIHVVARVAIFFGLNLNRVFCPKVARERGEPWTMRGLSEAARMESESRYFW